MMAVEPDVVEAFDLIKGKYIRGKEA